LTLDVKKSNSSNETPNVMAVGAEKYGLNPVFALGNKKTEQWTLFSNLAHSYYSITCILPMQVKIVVVVENFKNLSNFSPFLATLLHTRAAPGTIICKSMFMVYNNVELLVKNFIL
jgi:hypothetical protein